MSKSKLEQIVTSRDSWNDHMDPNNYEPGSFDKRTLHQRITDVCAAFPGDVTADDKKYANQNGVNIISHIERTIRSLRMSRIRARTKAK